MKLKSVFARVNFMKKMILAILLAATALTVSATEIAPVEKQSTIEDVVIKKSAASVDGEEFFYLHCRLRRRSNGTRYYEFCRSYVIGRNGKPILLGDVDPRRWPPIPEEEVSEDDYDDERTDEEEPEDEGNTINLGDLLNLEDL